jgi:uncharacterized protein
VPEYEREASRGGTIACTKSREGTTVADTIDAQLLDILACPTDDHAPLRVEGDALVCTSCGRRYPVVDGIPVLLIDEAELPSAGV